MTVLEDTLKAKPLPQHLWKFSLKNTNNIAKIDDYYNKLFISTICYILLKYTH